jgi:uncharacterized membrane protein YeaQ/YmgE (transglycosylase-associated protein family)
MITAVFGWVLFGLVVGLIARFLVPGDQPMTWLMTTVLGIVGSLLGGFVHYMFFGLNDGRPEPGGFLMSVLGAVILLAVYVGTARGSSARA